MALVNVDNAARRLNCKPGSLYSLKYRAELGLPCVRLGRHIKFDERDIDRVIESRKESLPIMPRSENGHDAA